MTVMQMLIAGGSWSPKQISTLVAWFDSSDLTTITKDGSNNVERWYDKVLTTRYGDQTNATLQPVYSATARNSRPGITFDGTGDRLPLTNITNFPTGTTDSSVFVVAYTVTADWKAVIGWGDLTLSGGNRSCGTSGAGYHAWDTWAASSEIGTVWSGDKLVYQTYRLSTSPDISQYAIDGGSLVDGTPAGDNSTDTVRGCIGDVAGSGATNTWQGTIQEIFVFSNIIAESDRRKIEGYAAHKWALSSSLPSDHPYKSGPP